MEEANRRGIYPTEVVSGAALGADRLGEEWARERDIPVTRFEADWQRYGRYAGPKRNQEMADYAQALVAVPVGESRGTRNMIETAIANGLPIYVHYE